MPHNYERETTTGNTPLNVMKGAIAKINDDGSIRAAVPHYRRPKKTDASNILIVFSLPHLNLQHGSVYHPIGANLTTLHFFTLS